MTDDEGMMLDFINSPDSVGGYDPDFDVSDWLAATEAFLDRMMMLSDEASARMGTKLTGMTEQELRRALWGDNQGLG